ncbi:hypothetical protein [Photobacterium phosphoreum]|uniref:hypothetical protein n=1 Tax=Photobacterium phosphoreum TaxID=659 RepID=UPI0007F90350|nr:hypothetical protein [Photobacterium phosphoreum]OBU37510.1 hypothetical protein AYY25_17560 [Photobacterium phosphoreum]
MRIFLLALSACVLVSPVFALTPAPAPALAPALAPVPALALAPAFAPPPVFAPVFDANGKTLNQFFVMSADVFKKAIIVDSDIKQNIVIYGSSNVDNFKSFFYSVLTSYNLSAFDDGTLIKISAGGKTNKTNIESIESFIATVTNDVYIDGSVSKKNGNLIRYYYSFSYSSGEIFDPSSVGLKISSLNDCMAHLSFNNYKTLITCNPKIKNRPVVIDDSNEPVEPVDSAADVVSDVIGV